MPSVNNTVALSITTGTVPVNLASNKLQIGATLQAGSVPVTIGTTAAVTASTGITIPAGQSMNWQGSNTNQLWAVSSSASTLSVMGN